MEKINHQLANKFWDTHFPELADTVLTERHALDSDFWGKLQVAYEASDADTLWAILFTHPPMRFEISDMYSRVLTRAKRVWTKKADW